MGLFSRRKDKPVAQESEKNEIGNAELKENLANTALTKMEKGVDYEELEGLSVEFGYLFYIPERGVESLFKVITDKGISYFVVQKSMLQRLSYTEELYKQTTEQFLSIHG